MPTVGVSPLRFLTKLNYSYGPYTLDRFATNYNTKCKRFNSRWWCPGTLGIDAFKQNWEGETNWIVPPPSLICECLKKFQEEEVKGTLIVPIWESAVFWPLLLNLKEKLFSTTGTLDQPRTVEVGRGDNGTFAEQNAKFMFCVLK